MEPPGTETGQDWYAQGWERLEKKFYPEAIRSFKEYLSRAQVSTGAAGEIDLERRAEVHTGAAIAMLAGAPPAYRTAKEIAGITNHLLAAPGTVLGPILAALVEEDYYTSAGTSPPPTLTRIAGRARLDHLTRDDVVLLAEHLVPASGATWHRPHVHGQLIGVPVREFVADEGDPPMEAERKGGVQKYFLPTPVAPRAGGAGVARLALGVGLGLLLMAAGVLVLSDDPASSDCLDAAVLGGGCALLIAGIQAYRTHRSYRQAVERFHRDWAAAEPKPGDPELDGWLREDVERIQALGARRHRLNRQPLARGGDLIIDPQVIVGLSRRTRTNVEHHLALDAHEPDGFRTVRRQVTVPVTHSRAGEDRQIRADIYHVLVLYLTKHRICVIQCELELATRRLVNETTRSFRYGDVTQVAATTIPESTGALSTLDYDAINVLFDDGSAGYRQVFVDNRFVLSLADGDRIEVGIGVSRWAGAGRDQTVAWANHRVPRVVDRIIAARREAGRQH